MSLIFKKLRWKNFLSTGNDWTEIDFQSVKTSLIVGDNGSGKSTMLDALCYALYGKPFRKINIPQIVNSINNRHTLVEVEFDTGSDEYLVRRGLKPNIFEVEKNGVLINQEAANKDYQEVLTKYILRMNQKAFCQVVILGSASFVPFMQLSAGHRREILEDLLDIQIFTVMNLLLKDKINDNLRDINDIDYKIDMINEKIRMNEEHREHIISNAQDIIYDIEENILKIERNIESERKIIKENEDHVNQIIEKGRQYSNSSNRSLELDALKSKLSHKLEKINSEISFFEEHDSCPTCKQLISEQLKKETKSEKSSALYHVNEAIKVLDSKIKDNDVRVNEYKSLFEEHNKLISDSKFRKNTIRGFENMVSDLKSQIDKIVKKNTVILEDDGKTSILEGELEKLSQTKKCLFELREVHKVASTILKDSGIKSKIIKQYIPIINKLINRYLSAMDFFVQFELDENFNETIKSRYRDSFSYASFSEGEKSKIDLALLFTWRTVSKMRNSASTNILILDEVFDGSIDANTEEELLKILTDMSNDSHIFVISHRTDRLLDKFDRIIKFEKKSNFSKMSIN